MESHQIAKEEIAKNPAKSSKISPASLHMAEIAGKIRGAKT
jgi:hypothetical protein